MDESIVLCKVTKHVHFLHCSRQVGKAVTKIFFLSVPGGFKSGTQFNKCRSEGRQKTSNDVPMTWESQIVKSEV